MHNYLKSAYVADAPSNQRDTWYRVEGSSGGPFASYSDIRFDNGSHGTWNVSWPDVLRGEQGGEIVMRYRGAPAPNGAAVAYKGAFPESAAGVSGSVMVLGFPLETVYPSDERNELVRDILRWMMPASTNIYNETGNENVATLYLSQNFPNPFNAQTTLRYELPVTSHTLLSIYNVLGIEVARLVDSVQPAGTHQVNWNAATLASGVYISRLTSQDVSVTRTMLLVK
jgi:hypothetical protein